MQSSAFFGRLSTVIGAEDYCVSQVLSADLKGSVWLAATFMSLFIYFVRLPPCSKSQESRWSLADGRERCHPSCLRRKHCQFFPELAPKLVSPMRLDSSFPVVFGQYEDPRNKTSKPYYKKRTSLAYLAQTAKRRKLVEGKPMLQVSQHPALRYIKDFPSC